MNRNIHAQIADQRGVDVRQASTANLFINSRDREGGPASPLNPLIISKNEAIMNGFFTRLAVQEICLNWGCPNIDASLDNNSLVFRIQTTGATNYTAALANGNYTVAELLDALVVGMNTAVVASGNPLLAGYVFSVVTAVPGASAGITLTSNGGTIQQNWSIPVALNQSTLNDDFLHLNDPLMSIPTRIPVAPDIRPYFYIDFVSSQLTYNQEVKDGTTQLENRDVLYRWYFSWDEDPNLDAYGFPIYQGYLPFTQRRCIAFPKQIKWAPNQPIGNLQITLYDNTGDEIDSGYLDTTEYQFTLLASEV